MAHTHTHKSPSKGHTDLVILYANHLRLSCQNGTAFQHCSLANRMIAVCHGNNLQGDTEENTTGMGRGASRKNQWVVYQAEVRRGNLRGKCVSLLYWWKPGYSTLNWNYTDLRHYGLKSGCHLWAKIHKTWKSCTSELPVCFVRCDPVPCSYINTLALRGNRKLGAPTLLNSFLWPTMHFISWASITHTPTQHGTLRP